ncbi:MAG: twin-arginine translocase TatA/TatE family subunit [Rickettsiaceae bacterium]
MGISIAQLLIVLLIILLLFGAGKLPRIMSDLGKGLKAFKNQINSDEDSDKSDKS